LFVTAVQVLEEPNINKYEIKDDSSNTLNGPLMGEKVSKYLIDFWISVKNK
jgi:hypothetical protein